MLVILLSLLPRIIACLPEHLESSSIFSALFTGHIITLSLDRPLSVCSKSPFTSSYTLDPNVSMPVSVWENSSYSMPLLFSKLSLPTLSLHVYLLGKKVLLFLLLFLFHSICLSVSSLPSRPHTNSLRLTRTFSHIDRQSYGSTQYCKFK